MLTAKLQRTIADERAGQETRLAENLKAIANAQHMTAIVGKFLHRLHHWAKACDGTGAQVIAVTEAAGDEHGVRIAQARFLVPKQPGRMAEDIAQHMNAILVAVGTGKLDDSKVHQSSKTSR